MRSAHSKVPTIAPAIRIVGIVCIFAGLYFIFLERSAPFQFKVLHYEFASTSVGLAVVAIGAILIGWDAFLRHRAVERTIPKGGAGGKAEAYGGGEAQGGRGGNAGPYGPGGNGGNARVIGPGKAKSGDGGHG